MDSGFQSIKYYLLLSLICLAFYLPGITSLPPVDRDEARFAQATSQMLETGDFVQIRFQNESRNKKPIAIYWLQSAAVALSGTLKSRQIWPYRIPSVLGGLLSVLLTFALGKLLFDRRTGLLGAAFCAGTFLLIIEAHMATTDALLLATIMASQLALSRFYMREDGAESPGKAVFLTFWIAQAIGILVKGPITPLISLLTIASLAAADRDLKWLKGLRPLVGLGIVAIIACPWAIAIAVATKGAFFQQAIGGDLLSKVGSGQESHGFPPGWYLLLLPLTLWPASPLAGVALYRAWKSRKLKAVRFCLAWIVPAWILFELVPTKLPHYVLPLYPPLCLLVAETVLSAAAGRASELGSKLVRLGFILCFLIPVCLGVCAVALPYFLDNRFEMLALVPVAAGFATAGFAVFSYLKQRYLRAAVISIVGTWFLLFPLFQWVLPDVNSVWLSRTVADAVKEGTGRTAPVASVGYYEPSLVFLLGTQTQLTGPAEAASFLKKHPEGIALVGSREDDDFRRETGNLGIPVKLMGSFRGFCYSKGKNMVLRLYGVSEQ